MERAFSSLTFLLSPRCLFCQTAFARQSDDKGNRDSDRDVMERRYGRDLLIIRATDRMNTSLGLSNTDGLFIRIISPGHSLGYKWGGSDINDQSFIVSTSSGDSIAGGRRDANSIPWEGEITNPTDGWLIQRDDEGVIAAMKRLPLHFKDVVLQQNYHNPFNPSTTIRLSLTPEVVQKGLKSAFDASLGDEANSFQMQSALTSTLSRARQRARFYPDFSDFWDTLSDKKVMVALKVFEVLGREVSTLLEGKLDVD